MGSPAFALEPERFLASIGATCDTLGRRRIELLEVVEHAKALTGGAPYAIVGGLAQMLWARKTHTDDLDIALTGPTLAKALEDVQAGQLALDWTLPEPPDQAREANDVFEVVHLLFRGVVVDLLTFADADFTAEILASAQPVDSLDAIRFIRPELLLVTHLLRPGPLAALAAIELVLARQPLGGLDVAYTERWAIQVARGDRLRDTLTRAAEFGRL